MTQRQRLREYLESGKSITRINAYQELGMFELSRPIGELEKEGMDIIKTREKSKNRFGESVGYVRYSLNITHG